RPELPAIPQAPAEGPLTRSDLIQLAIQSHPDFWRFRGEVAYYLQAEFAAYDWRDPELRIGFDYEFEADLAQPFEETSTINTVQRGYFDTTTRTNFVEYSGVGNSQSILSEGTTVDRELTDQTRRITTETVRRRTPGKYQTITDNTVYEVERRSESSRQNRQGPGITGESQNSREYSRRRVLSRSREYENHPNDLYGDQQFVVTARLFIPNPWEMRARAARARAEAGLSNQRMRTELRDLVFDVGRRYDELQFRHAWHQANISLLDLMQRNQKSVEEFAASLGGTAAAAAAAGVANLFDPTELPRARLEVYKAREEVFDSRRELALVKEELGVLCGLDDPNRIQFTNVLRLRKIDERHLDQAALIELARAHRPDLAEMKARSDVERARLREVKALRLPWINDLRVGYGLTTSDGYRDQDEISALLTFNFPLISPWQNKAHRQHEEAIANFEEAQRVMNQRIDGQVAFAIRAVNEAARALADVSHGEKLLSEDLKKNTAEAKVVGGDKGKRIELASEETEIKSGRSRLQALYHYNQAVAHLELALGLPLEEAFAPAPAKAAPGAK
ncbi:MAG: TolC family protein, partial [Verrucomicrobiales bacterium]